MNCFHCAFVDIDRKSDVSVSSDIDAEAADYGLNVEADRWEDYMNTILLDS